MDYFNDPLPIGAVIYVADIPFQYSEKEGTYTEVLDNPTGNVFLAASNDLKFLLCHRHTVVHTSTEFGRFSQNNPITQQAIYHYCLLISVTHYTQHIIIEKEIIKKNTEV